MGVLVFNSSLAFPPSLNTAAEQKKLPNNREFCQQRLKVISFDMI
jgi:hypothetical protein